MLFLLHGKETYLRRRQAATLLKEAQDKGAVVQEIDCREGDITRVFSELNTPSLFYTAKFFLFNEPFGLPEWHDKELQKILLACKHTLVFVAGEVKKSDPFFTFLAQHAKVEEFRALKGAHLASWVQKEFEKQKLSLAPGAKDLLLFALKDDLERLSREIEKLATFKRFSLQKTVSKEDVLSLVAQRQEPKIFSTIDAISTKNQKLATKLLAGHLKAGEAPLQLLGMFAWQFRLLLSIKDLEKRGVLQKEIARKLKLHPFVAQKSFEATKRFSLEELQELLKRLFALDLALKTSKGNPDQLLYLFVGQAAFISKEKQRV